MISILIAEDNKIVRQGLVNIISKTDIEFDKIIQCKNGLEAFDTIKNNQIDVLITDIKMPMLDGVTLIKKIQKLNNIPKIIVISGYEDFSDVIDLLRCGVKEYLLKPIKKTQLILALQKVERECRLAHREEKERIKFFYEKIKYTLLKIESSNLDEIYSLAIRLPLEKKYVIIATNFKTTEYITNYFFYFENIQGHNIIITSKEYSEKLIYENMEAYGLSSEYNSFHLLIPAVEEAINNRIINYMLIKTSNNLLKNKGLTEIDMNRIIQSIGTKRVNESCSCIKIIINSVKRSEITVINFIDFMEITVKRIFTTYKELIDDSDHKLMNLFEFNNIDLFYDALICLLENINKKLLSEHSNYKNKLKIEEAIMYIEKNYKNDINMTIVSNYVSMNYSIFSIDFKEYTGKNFVNYLKDIRLKEAKRLLNETDMKVIEISEAVGYENDKHFLKIFKQVYSVTPSEYRKNVKLGKNYNAIH